MAESKGTALVADAATDAEVVTEEATDVKVNSVAPDAEAVVADADADANADVDGATIEAGDEAGEVLTSERVAEMVEEAEQRGYLRGRNESIEELMRRPGMFERVPDVRVDDVDQGNAPEILSRRRVSIWER